MFRGLERPYALVFGAGRTEQQPGRGIYAVSTCASLTDQSFHLMAAEC